MQTKELKREAVKVVTASTRAGEADLEDTEWHTHSWTLVSEEGRDPQERLPLSVNVKGAGKYCLTQQRDNPGLQGGIRCLFTPTFFLRS